MAGTGWDEAIHGHTRKSHRNIAIFHAYRAGKRPAHIAREFGISGPRVHEIITREKSKMTHTKDIGIAICDGLEHVQMIERYKWQGNASKGVVNLRLDPVGFETNSTELDNLIIKTSDGATFKVIILNMGD